MVNLQYRIFTSEIDIIEWADQPQCLYYDYGCLLAATIYLIQPLTPWYNPFGDAFQLQIVDVHPFLSMLISHLELNRNLFELAEYFSFIFNNILGKWHGKFV